MKKVLIGLAAAAMAVVGVGGAASAAPEFDDGSLYDDIQGSDPIYARILAAAGLDSGVIDLGDCSEGAPQYTVFLPAIPALVFLVQQAYDLESSDGPGEPAFDVAFDSLLADKATLRGLLSIHVHGGTLTAEMLSTAGYTNIPTLGGVNLSKTVEVVEGEEEEDPYTVIFINGYEVVYSYPLSCNGAIHVIAGIIQPPAKPAAPSCGASYAGTAQCPAGTSGSGSGLPKTGSESMALTYAALASLIVGAGVLVIRRRSIA